MFFWKIKSEMKILAPLKKYKFNFKIFNNKKNGKPNIIIKIIIFRVDY